MSADETFLSRWARLKREGARAVPAAPASQPLPPLESLDFASDFTAFLQDQVEESLKRAALKKLFHSPQFNVMDGLDVYIDDYGIADPIPEEMLSRLAHAREMLFGPQPVPPAEQGAGGQANGPAPVAEGRCEETGEPGGGVPGSLSDHLPSK